MYYIYVDEAGTAENEPVTVVIGIIIQADDGWSKAAEHVRLLIKEFVPEKFREGFIFHAKSVWGDKRYRDEWPMEERLAFISAMVSLPRELGLAISLGKVRRDSLSAIERLSKSDSDHLMAFAACLWRSNKYVQDWGKKNEIATVVAEDVPEKRQKLKLILDMVRANDGTPADPDFIHLTEEEKIRGQILQTRSKKVDRIIDTIHFVTKEEAPLIQIADACAFVFRRFLQSKIMESSGLTL